MCSKIYDKYKVNIIKGFHLKITFVGFFHFTLAVLLCLNQSGQRWKQETDDFLATLIWVEGDNLLHKLM